jgi:hypothetical protein
MEEVHQHHCPPLRYFFHNGTGSPAGLFSGTSLQQLITVTGAGSARGETAPHAVGITIRGVRLADAALSTLSPHGLPSDGGGESTAAT